VSLTAPGCPIPSKPSTEIRVLTSKTLSKRKKDAVVEALGFIHDILGTEPGTASVEFYSKPSMSDKSRMWACYHEAGHAVVSTHLGVQGPPS